MSEGEQQQQRGGGKGARILAGTIGLLCLLFGLDLLMSGFEANDTITIILGLFVFSLFFSFMGAAWRAPVQRQIFKTVTVMKCSKCDYTEVRDFQQGDYVYKVIGKCKECDGEEYVKSIYAVPLQQTRL